MLFSNVCSNRWSICTFDVKVAFLHSLIDKLVYIWPPKGIVTPKHSVLKLKKALYGTRQAARCWWLHLKDILQQIGFQMNGEDLSTYYYYSLKGRAVLWIHFNDGALTRSSIEVLDYISDKMNKRLQIKWDTAITSLVGLLIEETLKGSRFSQTELIDKLIYLTPSRITSSSPLPPHCKLESAASTMLDKEYLKHIGILLYISQGSRPDISYSVKYLARYSRGTNNSHWEALEHLIAYMRKTRMLGIQITGSDLCPTLRTYVNANWGGEGDRSTDGFLLLHVEDRGKVYSTTVSQSLRPCGTLAPPKVFRKVVPHLLDKFYIVSLNRQTPLLQLNKKMLSLDFQFQLVIFYLAFTLTSASAVPEKPTTSNQTCNHGLSNPKGAAFVTCDTDGTNKFICPIGQCHITVENKDYRLSNYYFTACKTDDGDAWSNALHPHEFTVSKDKKSVVVTSGWIILVSYISYHMEVKKTYKCPIKGYPLNLIRASRPMIMTQWDHQELSQIITRGCQLMVAQVTNLMTHTVSTQTIQREIHKLAHCHWTINNWAQVIWTDELAFKLGKKVNQVQVWRTPQEKWNLVNLAVNHQLGRQSLMIEQAPWIGGRHRLLLMEDNTPNHTAQASTDWKNRHNIIKLNWPAPSPNLNPIKMYGRQ
ncbi:hypothetical protein O181_041688 [Austropuccinia psidii MF-1]|uniref:Reverse transcriptase Ty1/copia-type domain-containing protein n=1 Tax=Austropuccinia psidii MF-1 TaxID=1389203 RepID=A0A9Q3DJN4_9BASI|nr:hypothetical protein [Austropuccinia psidii MF-1]